MNPSTVSAPLRIHAPEVPSAASLTEDHAEPQSLPSTTLHAAPDTTPEGLEGDNACPMAVKLLCELQAGVERIPADKPKAIPSHRLSAFSVDPSSCIGQGDDDWEDILNPMMKGAFGWGEDAMCKAVKEMLQRGQWGLDGFIRFLRFFVMTRGLKGAMFESKIKALLEELEIRYPSSPSCSAVTVVPETIDVDNFDELLEGSAEIELWESTTACKGILVEFPAGKNLPYLIPIWPSQRANHSLGLSFRQRRILYSSKSMSKTTKKNRSSLRQLPSTHINNPL